MQKLHIGIVDVVSKAPTRALYASVMNANLASIMPQAIGVWSRQLGHDVTLVCYTGFEDLLTELPDTLDILFIGAFTEAALTAYALSNLFRARGGDHRSGGGRMPGVTPKTPCGTSITCLVSQTGRRCSTFCRTAGDIGRLVCTFRPNASHWRSRVYASVGSLFNRRSGKHLSSKWFRCSEAWGVLTRAVSASTQRSPISR